MQIETEEEEKSISCHNDDGQGSSLTTCCIRLSIKNPRGQSIITKFIFAASTLTHRIQINVASMTVGISKLLAIYEAYISACLAVFLDDLASHIFLIFFLASFDVPSMKLFFFFTRAFMRKLDRFWNLC